MNTSAALENARGIGLRAQGRSGESIAVFERALAEFPEVVELALNLAQTLYEAGENDRAVAAFQRALAIDPRNVAAHLGLWELLQISGDRATALDHQRKALERQRVFSSIASHEARSVLVLHAPGDWQANVPVDFLFDRATTSVHKLYLIDYVSLAEDSAPRHDVVWNAIAESPDAAAYLDLASEFVRNDPRPSLNASDRVAATARMELGHTLAGVDCTVAPIREIEREDLAAARQPFAYPVIARPVGSHAGHGLEKIDDANALRGYARDNDAASYYVSPFVDYRNDDGFFRKYRIVFVDGEIYPVHLAISPRWMIHYYNAAMAENAWMRDEEARFLEDARSVFSGATYEALERIAAAVGLEYFGIDCSIGRDGRVLVFEADPAMLVHSSDPVDLYPYKQRYIPRIYRAVERMIDRRKAADT